MASAVETSLTRKVLQEELKTFADGYLASTLREALLNHLKEISSAALQLNENSSKIPPRGPSEDGSVEERKPNRRTMNKSSPLHKGYSVLPDAGAGDSTDMWAPSAKYGKSATRATFVGQRATFIGSRPPFQERTQDSRDLEEEEKPAISDNDDGHRGSTRALMAASQIEDEPVTGQVSLPVGDDGNTNSCWFKLRTIVQSSLFEHMSALLVVINSISLGYDTNYSASHPGSDQDAVMKVMEPLFCLLFTTELALRIAAFGCGFFTMEGCRWNWFDTLLVSIQIFEQLLQFLSQSGGHKVNLGVFRLMRLLRITRFARLFRVFHLFDDLRVIVSSIFSSIQSLLWSMVLLLILIYVFSLVFLQCIVTAGETPHHDDIHHYFSTLFRTFLTMFECVVGGVNWDHVVRPIASDISPVLAILFCVYVSACLFAMMNIMTGIFVDKATTSVREDKDIVLAKRVRDVFFTKESEDGNADITWEFFERKVEAPAMQDYFKQINIEISEARALFDLMDADGSGSLDAAEIVRACLRLRGPARALDLSILTREVSELHDQLRNIEDAIMQLPRKP